MSDRKKAASKASSNTTASNPAPSLPPVNPTATTISNNNTSNTQNIPSSIVDDTDNSMVSSNAESGPSAPSIPVKVIPEGSVELVIKVQNAKNIRGLKGEHVNSFIRVQFADFDYKDVINYIYLLYAFFSF